MNTTATGAMTRQRALWIADKIPALGDYAKEAADLLRQFAAASLPVEVGAIDPDIIREMDNAVLDTYASGRPCAHLDGAWERLRHALHRHDMKREQS